MESRLENLSLLKKEEEKEELVLEYEDLRTKVQSFYFYLMGIFLTDRRINFNAMRNKVASMWRPGRGMCIMDLNSSCYLFQFFQQVDMKKVLEGAPWTFDNHLLLLHQLKEGEVLIQIAINHIEF